MRSAVRTLLACACVGMALLHAIDGFGHTFRCDQRLAVVCFLSNSFVKADENGAAEVGMLPLLIPVCCTFLKCVGVLCSYKLARCAFLRTLVADSLEVGVISRIFQNI
jgi:hypothetical protein